MPWTWTDPSAPSRRAVFLAVENITDDERAVDFAAATAHRWGVPLVALRGTSGRGRSETHGLTTGDAARYSERYPGLTIESRAVAGRDDGPMWWARQGAQLIVVGSLVRGRAAGALSGWTRHFLPIVSPCAVAVVRREPRSTA